MKVAIIGQGYVGLTVASFAMHNHEVVGYVNNEAIVTALNSGISHIEGVSGSSILKAIASGKYKATNTPSDLSGAEIVVICVLTPLNEKRKPDLCRTHTDPAICSNIDKINHGPNAQRAQLHKLFKNKNIIDIAYRSNIPLNIR